MYGTDFFASKPLAAMLKSSVTTSNVLCTFFLVVNGTLGIYEATYFSSVWSWQVAVHLKWGQRISKLRAKFFDAALYAVIYDDPCQTGRESCQCFQWTACRYAISRVFSSPHKFGNVSIFMAHKRSCRKLLFSQVSVILLRGEKCIGTWVPTLLDMGPKHLPLLLLDMDTYPLPCYWHLVVITGEICSNLFTWGSTLPRTQPPPQYWHLVMATKACTVGKQAVHILLECSFFWKSMGNSYQMNQFINSNAIINLASLHWIIT